LAHAVHDLWPSIQIIVTSAFRAPNGARLPDGGQFFQKPYQSSQITQAIREMVA
jgi:two-component system, response regulator PdtaR